MTISEADASPRLRSLWRGQASLQRKDASLDTELKETHEQLRKVNTEIDDETRYLTQKNSAEAASGG